MVHLKTEVWADGLGGRLVRISDNSGARTIYTATDTVEGARMILGRCFSVWREKFPDRPLLMISMENDA